ncbi:MAG TPA: quinol:electron acceptor oxidoreductase subunit ActD [Anaerolineales bacterium]|nr:quinol:electron acceptor oxidoreductase subunit ActD [Anaerolineales bacterium]
MTETTLLALFDEDKIDPAADAIEKLHEMGIPHENINVISGVPIAHKILGRPHPWTNVSRLALGGAVVGFCIGFFLNYGTPLLYNVPVGGQYITPVPPGMILIFEMTMLFALLSTFLGVFLDSYFPNYRPMEYVPEISDGKIGVFFKYPAGEQEKYVDVLSGFGAESVRPVEVQQL